jgi:transposase
MTDMREYAAKGHIDRAPSYNSTFRCLENPAVTPILKAMIEESARPMRPIETDFAADSTGFTTRVYQRWYDSKYGRMKIESGWIKAHVMTGVRTNIVTAVEVTGPTASDYRQFKPLLDSTAARFDIEKVSADKAYSGRGNIEAIHMIGAFPLIPFKSNTTAAQGPPLWKRMYHFFLYNQDEFMQHYHKRSNVETTFSMIKAKFGGFVRSKLPTAQVNEVLCKVLCHNLCVLVQISYEVGKDATFWAA